MHPEDRDRVWQAHRVSEADDRPFDEEVRLLSADGQVVWTRAVDTVVEDEDGRRRRIGFMLDITTAKTAEIELRDTMSRLTTLLDHMQSGVLVEDAAAPRRDGERDALRDVPLRRRPRRARRVSRSVPPSRRWCGRRTTLRRSCGAPRT